MSENKIQTLDNLLKELEGILPSESNWSQVENWISRVTPIINEHFHQHSSEFKKETSKNPIFSFPIVNTTLEGLIDEYRDPERDADYTLENNKEATKKANKIINLVKGIIISANANTAVINKELSQGTDEVLKKDGKAKVKVFLSYSSSDKLLAGAIKEQLENRFGVEAFLAHEDIEGGDEWIITITRELNSCDVFIPILTENFIDSKWTDQETGFALCRNIQIIPISAGSIPHGFINKYQAIRTYDPKEESVNFRSSIYAVVKKISENPQLRDLFLNNLIDEFASSSSFDIAGENSKTLLMFDNYNSTQKNNIIKTATYKRQISDSYKAEANINKFIDRYKKELDPPIIEGYKNRVN